MWVMSLVYGGGYQPNLFFEIIDNVLKDTQGLGIVIDGALGSNSTLSMGHVVRGLHQTPPESTWGMRIITETKHLVE